MFNKEYPKSCTMIDMGFGPKGDVYYKYYVGSGFWLAEESTRIFYVNTEPMSEPFARTGATGFRGGIYVQ